MARQRSSRTPLADTRISGLVIQLLTTEWTKGSRNTPLSLVLPKAWAAPGDAAFRLHHVYFSEQRDFVPRVWTDARRGRSFVEVEAFRIERDGQGVRVLLDHGGVGLPGGHEGLGMAREQDLEPLFHLSPSEWGRGVYHERIQYWETGHWGYCKHVVNVGLLEGADPDVFLSTRLDHQAVREFLPRQRGTASVGLGAARLLTLAS